MKKESIITSIFLLVIWQCAAMFYDNMYLLPSPVSVVVTMLNQFQSESFFEIVLMTSFRTMKGVLMSLLLGLTTGLLSANFKRFERYFAPVHQMMKTIPNISYMILILLWLGQEKSVTVIVFFILYPIFHSSFYQAGLKVRASTSDLLQIYPVTVSEKWLKIDLPMLMPDVFESLRTGVGMGLKVCVMAEILSQVKQGIGRQMNIGRLYLDLSSVFAWTIWMIAVSILIQKAIDFVQKITSRKVH